MNKTLRLFEAYGVELEYMVVDRQTLNVRPIADQVFHQTVGAYASEIERGAMAWSNELALHIIELKTNGPVRSWTGLAQRFQQEVMELNEILNSMDACLMPTAMHPWMDPAGEFKLWPHEYSPVYEAFHDIFDCRSHGWANLQSVHLNLPFADDDEFGRLHAAIRLLLPIMPALAASSPIAEGKLTGLIDTRLENYRHHTHRIPCLTAKVIPEQVFTQADYESHIFRPIRHQLVPFDPQHLLRPEWSNARGAIARFDRGAIEIRVLDVQECPAADVAIAAAISHVLQRMVAEQWTPVGEQMAVPVPPLVDLLLRTIREGELTVIEDPSYLAHLGLSRATTVGEVWQSLLSGMGHDPHLSCILQRGPLSRRIIRALDAGEHSIRDVYQELCACLAKGKSFGESA